MILPMAEVLDDETNENEHPPGQHELLRASVRLYGQQEPILIDKNKKVIGGHGIKGAMLAEGYTHIRCQYSDLEGAKRNSYRIVTNQLGRLSYFNMDLLPTNIAAIITQAGQEGLAVDHEWFGLEPDELAHLRGGDEWRTKSLDPNDIGDYDAAKETFIIKIEGIIQKDKVRILKKVRTALSGTTYEPICF